MGAYNNWPLIINLGNSIIGVAVLAMPFCFKQCGILLGMLTLLFCTWLTLCSSSLLMKAGIISRRRSYEFLAYHTHGATGKFVSEIGMIGMQMGTLIAQIVVIGDLGPAIISKLLGIENTSNLRTWLLIFLCLGVGMPMGMLKDLRTVSRGSTVCIAFYCSFVVYILIMSVPNLWSGDWYFKVNFWRPQGLFQCLPILSFSFGCQTQLFLVYEELPEPSLKDISGVTSSAVNLCAVAYLLVGFFGYITFHAVDVPGDILAAFPSNIIADLMKLCFVFSIVITFPVIIFPCRASIYTLLFAKKTKAYDDTFEGNNYIPESIFKTITITIILSSMITGILIPNVEFILGMNGAIMGTLICYIFPALFFIKVMGNNSEGKTKAQLVLFLGVTILLVSTFATLSSQDKGHTHLENEGDLLAVNPNELNIEQIDKHVTAWNKKVTVKPILDMKDNLVKDQKNKVVEQPVQLEQRKEPPVPDPPMSNDKDLPPKADTVKKRNVSDVKVKSVNTEAVKKKEEISNDTNLEAKKKELEAEHKAKEKELKEKEKKQEEILEKLEKHRQDQEKLLKEQIEVLKELKSHKEKDESKDPAPAKKEEELVKKEEKVKDEIVKRQQELLDQQQKVNLQQQELIKQQQQQINQQIMKDSQKMSQASVKPQQELNQGLQQKQQGLNPQQQGLNPQQQQGLNPQQQQGLNPQQQQGLNLQQQGENPQQQQGLNPQQQQGLNPQQQQGLNPQQQQGLNPQQQQGFNPQQLQGLNPQQQQDLNLQQQQGLNPQQQKGLNQQKVLNAQQNGLNPQGLNLPLAGLNQPGVGVNQGLNHPVIVNKEMEGVNKAVIDQPSNQRLDVKNPLN